MNIERESHLYFVNSWPDTAQIHIRSNTNTINNNEYYKESFHL
jgi:hypothetical protein